MITSQYRKFQEIAEAIKTNIRDCKDRPLQSANYLYRCPVRCFTCGEIEEAWAEKLSEILIRNEVSLERLVEDIGPNDKPRFSLVEGKLHWMWDLGADCFDTEELLFHIARALS